MNLKGGVDQSPPRAFPHIADRNKYKNQQKREINIQNAKMLKKIMEIMNRKPKENGLQGLPLKPLHNFEGSIQEDPFENSFSGQNNITVIQGEKHLMSDSEMNQNQSEYNIQTDQQVLGNTGPTNEYVGQSDVTDDTAQMDRNN